MLYVHTMALSEPLFIFLCLTGLFFLTEYLEKGGRGFLLAGAVVSGLAFLTRYSAAALIGTGLVGLCLIAKKPTFKKLPAALAFLFLSCLPLAGFILANSLRAGRVPFRRPIFPVMDASFLPELRSTLSSWAVPGSDRIELFSGQNPVLSLGAAAVLLMILTGAIVPALRGRKGGLPEEKASGPGMPFLFALFVPVYLGVFLLAEVFVGGLLRPGIRLLSPAFAPFLVATASLVQRWLGSLSKRGLRRAGSVLLAAYTLVYAGCGIYWMSICRRNGRGYNSRAYQAPEVVQALNEVRALGAVPIFTNDCGAVYFQAGRYAYSFPSEVGTKNPAALAKALGTAPACFVYYWTPPHLAAVEGNMDRDRFEKSLIETLALRILVRSETITVLGRPASN
jgi:4-amino-4-deoxy-L-arabinose transferase-like glycosyltransferase